MAHSIYTREEIEVFVDGHLKVLGMPGNDIDPQHVHDSYVRAITLLPSWQQVLLIESRAVSVFGDQRSIQYVHEQSGGKRAVNGFFKPGDLSVEFNAKEKLQGRNMIFWHTGARGEAGMITRSHEEGHRIDMLLGADERQPYAYFSARNPVLKQALADELRHREERRAQAALPPLPGEGVKDRGLLAWLNKCLARPVRQAAPSRVEIEGALIEDKLYDDYREIEDHLALYEDRGGDETEAFAEMTGHHTVLYARYDGNRAAIDYALTTHYPHYWPAYRDIAIPEMERRAEALLEKRQEMIDNYVTAAWGLADARGQEFDEPSVRHAAAIAAAKGTCRQEAHAMSNLRALYDRPVEPALRAFQDLAEMHWYALTPVAEQMKTPYTFNDRQVRAQMEDYLDAAGIDQFVEYIKQLRLEARELAEFSSAEERFTRAVGLPEITSGSAQARTVIDRFDALVAESGPAGAKAYRQALPTMAQVDSYIFARTSWQETRDSLLQEDAVVAVPADGAAPAALEQELRELAEAGGRDKVMAARDLLRDETRVLSNYYSRLNMVAETIGRLTGEDPPYFTGRETLAQFNALNESGGLQAVRSEIARLTIPAATMMAYASAREDSESARVSIAKEGGDMSWGRKDGLYRPFSVAVNEMAKGFMQRLSLDMRALVMQGGAEALAAETARLRQETHMAMAHALGKVPAQGTGMG